MGQWFTNDNNVCFPFRLSDIGVDSGSNTSYVPGADEAVTAGEKRCCCLLLRTWQLSTMTRQKGYVGRSDRASFPVA